MISMYIVQIYDTRQKIDFFSGLLYYYYYYLPKCSVESDLHIKFKVFLYQLYMRNFNIIVTHVVTKIWMSERRIKCDQ